ncbi:MAG: hypothetical protein Q8K50_22170 [Hydrogenophaga sp.]|nr:hypothetical protein [Hydrogenophaga sp.]
MNTTTAQLLAIVSVDSAQRVRCQNPGCGHSVYRAIHVVRDGGELLVLGSTCFAKRYGSAQALGSASHGGGTGRVLTEQERELLAHNTAELVARFEAEERRKAEERATFVVEIKARETHFVRMLTAPALPAAAARPPGLPGLGRAGVPHWPWMKPTASFGYFKLHDGSAWVRVLHQNGQHVLVPWPVFEGWDEALPGHLGRPDLDLGGYVLANVQAAVAYLQKLGQPCKVFGSWRELVAGTR